MSKFKSDGTMWVDPEISKRVAYVIYKEHCLKTGREFPEITLNEIEPMWIHIAEAVIRFLTPGPK